MQLSRAEDPPSPKCPWLKGGQHGGDPERSVYFGFGRLVLGRAAPPYSHIRQQQRDWTVSKAFLKIPVIGLFTESGEEALISDGFLLS